MTFWTCTCWSSCIYGSYVADTHVSQTPIAELKLPPPYWCAYSFTEFRAHSSQHEAIAAIDMGPGKHLTNLLNSLRATTATW